MKKNKIVALALAGTLTVTAMLAGTYAWMNFDQIATNEVIDVTNPGGRLHDDFKFTDNGNKDIYVENFTTEAENGTQIYARIRLDEYMEIGAKAGQYLTAAEGKVVRIIQDADDTTTPEFEDRETWTTYLWGREKKQESGTPITVKADELSEFRKYILWETGGQTVYLPTFNRNRDSLESDINGTYEGTDGIRNADDPYTDHETYVKNTAYDGYEILDIDSDSKDELGKLGTNGLSVERILEELIDTTNNGVLKNITTATIDIDKDPSTTNDVVTVGITPIMDAATNSVVDALEINVDTTEEDNTGVDPDEKDNDIKILAKNSHTAKETLSADLISMERWKAPVASSGLNSAPGDYWVYDEDGWVYWANPIDPETATGLLLDRIYMRADADATEEYYYAINVVAQFATAGDWGTGEFTTIAADGTVTKPTNNGTGFYEDGITENGLYLLETIRNAEKTVTISTLTIPSDGLSGKATNNTATFKASVQQGTAVLTDSVTWDIEGETSADTKITVDTTTGIATLTVGATESADSINVVAKTTGTNVAVGTLLIPIGDYYEITIAMEQPAGVSTVSAQTTEATGYVGQGSVRTFTAEVKKNGTVTYDVGVDWKVEGNTSDLTEITTDGVLRIASDEKVGGSLKVTAICREDNTTISEPYTVGPVEDMYDYIRDYMQVASTEDTVTIDGISWYLMKKRDDTDGDGNAEALLWASDNLTGKYTTMKFDYGEEADNVWKTSAIKEYLNGDFLNNELAELGKRAITTKLITRVEYNTAKTETSVDKFVPTDDKVFLFSEADMFGTFNGSTENVDDRDYTIRICDEFGTVIGHEDVLVDGNYSSEDAYALRATTNGWYWLRSPRDGVNRVAYVSSDGSSKYTPDYNNSGGYLRPALWINLSSVITPNTGQ